jgi:hypothetical protein
MHVGPERAADLTRAADGPVIYLSSSTSFKRLTVSDSVTENVR